MKGSYREMNIRCFFSLLTPIVPLVSLSLTLTSTLINYCMPNECLLVFMKANITYDEISTHSPAYHPLLFSSCFDSELMELNKCMNNLYPNLVNAGLFNYLRLNELKKPS